MTPEDLNLVLGATGHQRYRELTADDHPHREFYRGEVARMAAELRGETPPRPRSLLGSVDAEIIAAIRRCPHRGALLPSREGCGCTDLLECRAGRGSLDGGAVATGSDCNRCVRASMSQ